MSGPNSTLSAWQLAIMAVVIVASLAAWLIAVYLSTGSPAAMAAREPDHPARRPTRPQQAASPPQWPASTSRPGRSEAGRPCRRTCLTATGRSSTSSSASQTRPMPPRPNSACGRKRRATSRPTGAVAEPSARRPGTVGCPSPAAHRRRPVPPRFLTVPASWHPEVAASRTAMRVLAMTTPGHCLATLDGKDRHDPNCGRMKDVTDTDHQTAPDGQRRQARAGGAGAPAGPPRPRHRSCQATAAAE
jgi:hypothetical protein